MDKLRNGIGAIKKSLDGTEVRTMIPENLMKVEQSIAELETIVAKLIDKLKPIVVPSSGCDKSETIDPPRPAWSSMAEVIDKNSYRIDVIREQLRNTLLNLDI